MSNLMFCIFDIAVYGHISQGPFYKFLSFVGKQGFELGPSCLLPLHHHRHPKINRIRKVFKVTLQKDLISCRTYASTTHVFYPWLNLFRPVHDKLAKLGFTSSPVVILFFLSALQPTIFPGSHKTNLKVTGLQLTTSQSWADRANHWTIISADHPEFPTDLLDKCCWISQYLV